MPAVNSLPHAPHLAVDSLGFPAGPRPAAPAPLRRQPSFRHASEQYLTRRDGARNGPPHAPHLAAFPSASAAASPEMPNCAYPPLRHASEQYRTARVRVENVLPHLQHLARLAEAPLAARATHGGQYICEPALRGLNLRPHRLHAAGSGTAARRARGL